MHARKPPKPLAPLDAASLQAIAIRYVEKYQTSRERLLRFLREKIRHRGWEEGSEPDMEALADKMVQLGYVNDGLFAQSRVNTFTRRGMGAGEIKQRLRQSGISEEDTAHVLEDHNAVEVALDFAKRKRLGIFGKGWSDPKERNRQMSAMMRAGHQMGLARRIIDAKSEEELPHPEE